MKPAGRLLPLICAIAALLAPASAGAATHAEVHPGRYLLSIELPQSHGWQMSISASGHREVELTAARGSTSVSYRAPGIVSSRRVGADFGSLGRIDLQLDLEARRTGGPRLHGRCTGKSPYELVGPFHGTIDFPGEPNVAAVFAHRGQATISRSFQHVCQPLDFGGHGKNPFQLDLARRAAGSSRSPAPTSTGPSAAFTRSTN